MSFAIQYMKKKSRLENESRFCIDQQFIMYSIVNVFSRKRKTI